MALLLQDCAMATSFVTVVTEHSLGVICLRKDKRTPNYQSLGLLHGYKLGDNGSLHCYGTPACGSVINVRQTIHLLDCFMATSLATDFDGDNAGSTCKTQRRMLMRTVNFGYNRDCRRYAPF
jgi:hypothetical protein